MARRGLARQGKVRGLYAHYIIYKQEVRR